VATGVLSVVPVALVIAVVFTINCGGDDTSGGC
jgi:hypothetical protein